jgi:hypothetical protein
MGNPEREPVIPPSFEVIHEMAKNNALSAEQNSTDEHGLRYILKRVKDGLTEGAKSLINNESAASVRDYLSTKDDDHRFVIEFIKSTNQKFDENPDLQRRGWEELWLPKAVEGQGWRVTRSQAERLIATYEFRSRRLNTIQSPDDEATA